MHLSEIYIYPIKSLGGISVDSAGLSDRGLQYDRRWMLVNPNGMFLSQRSSPEMALLQANIEGDNMLVRHKTKPIRALKLSLNPPLGNPMRVQIWQDELETHMVEVEADRWFSEVLQTPCHLVYMAEQDHRPKRTGDLVSFADGYPHLLIGQSSLDLLNSKLEEAVSMDRFRPNLVFSGGKPHEEDHWQKFQIGPIDFQCVNTCIRCQVPNIDQATGQMQKEPNRTLATYRQQNKQIIFGVNLLHKGSGEISVGMEIKK